MGPKRRFHKSKTVARVAVAMKNYCLRCGYDGDHGDLQDSKHVFLTGFDSYLR